MRTSHAELWRDVLATAIVLVVTLLGAVALVAVAGRTELFAIPPILVAVGHVVKAARR